MGENRRCYTGPCKSYGCPTLAHFCMERKMAYNTLLCVGIKVSLNSAIRSQYCPSQHTDAFPCPNNCDRLILDTEGSANIINPWGDINSRSSVQRILHSHGVRCSGS